MKILYERYVNIALTNRCDIRYDFILVGKVYVKSCLICREDDLLPCTKVGWVCVRAVSQLVKGWPSSALSKRKIHELTCELTCAMYYCAYYYLIHARL